MTKILDIQRLLQLPEAQRILARPAHVREALMEVLQQLAQSEDSLADVNWQRRKGPVAAYHAGVATRARITARAAKRGIREVC